MSKSICFVFMMLLGSQAGAEGRLFYTAEQRAGLEHARLYHVTERDASQPRTRPAAITYEGVVLRSDGRNTRWINGHPVDGSAAPPVYKGRSLKPGQSVANGRIYEPHQVIRETEP
ncbi:MAG TPA: hypothetical protein VEP67_10860 [Thiobacillaceae bacterium]|nr:hypothetical protein [Thiobacillaceae bacterium]